MDSAYLLGYICAGSCLVSAAVVAMLLRSVSPRQPPALPANVLQHGDEFKARTFDSSPAGEAAHLHVMLSDRACQYPDLLLMTCGWLQAWIA